MKGTTLELALDLVVDQAVFASAVGISEARVSQLMADGVLSKGEPAKAWLRAYCERLREQAAGRGQELTMERAALARSQRIGQDIRNAIAEKQYAPIGLLAEVLAAASQAVAERFEHLPARLRKACPELPMSAIDQLVGAIAEARSEWEQQTAVALAAKLAPPAAEEPEPGAQAEALSDEPRAD